MALSSWIRTWKHSLERRWALQRTLRRPSVARRRAIRPCLEVLENRWLLSAYVVTSTADDGSTGTLRDGINQTNASGGAITEIDFNIGAAGSTQTINLTSQLPTLTANGVFIKGLSQGNVSTINQLIILNGKNAGSSSDGLLIQGTHCSVSGLILENFSKNGIEVEGSNNTIGGTAIAAGNIISGNTDDGVLIDSGVSGVQVWGNFIGTDITGLKAVANSIGIEDAGSGNTLGGSIFGARNVIAGNANDGVLLDSSESGDTVEGDYLGLNAADKAGLANGANGLEVKGTNNTIGGSSGTNYYVRNFFTSNGNDGVLIDSGSTGNQLLGNFIGLGVGGSLQVGNTANGVEIAGNSNSVGGTSSAVYNVISANKNDGVWIDSGATGNLIRGNDIGTDYSGKTAVANSGSGVEVAGNGNTLGGIAGVGNILSGNSGDGVRIDSGASGVLLLGNTIGVNIAGSALANAGNGVNISGTKNTLGGTAYGSANFISGNTKDGVLMASGASGNLLLGNFLGVNLSGSAAGNSIGVEIAGTKNTIGGTAAGSLNVLSGNSADGVLIDSGGSSNLVLGNFIGLNAAGNAVGNSNGVEIAGTSNTLGGTNPMAVNVLSGNSNDGVLIDSGASSNQVLGNLIGTNPAGTGAKANKVGIEDAGNSNTLGGNVAGGRNVISGNTTDGILLDSTATAETVSGDYVGLNAADTAALANGGNGVEIKGTSNTIGGSSGTNYYVRNFIVGNGNDGVLIDSGGTGNQLLGNFIGIAVGGTLKMGNTANGIEIAGNSNTVGGTTSAVDNVISANKNDGVLIDSGATGNLIRGNDIGTDYTGKNSAGNTGSGIEVGGNGNTLGGSVAGSANVISGNGGDGVTIDSGGSGNLVLGNSIGVNLVDAALANSSNGVKIAGTQNTIGGTAYGALNIISGNSKDGVLLASSASGNLVLGNFVGVNFVSSITANSNGIEIAGTQNTVGGSARGDLNVISGNSKDGVLIDSTGSGNVVLGNFIGLTAAGNAAANGTNGVEIAGTSNTVGSTNSAARNVISSNNNDGVLIDSGASSNQVLGNFIGTNVAGTAAKANQVGIEDAGNSNTIGGSILGGRNIISGNSGDGLLLDSSATAETAWGNFMGLSVLGTVALADGTNGIEIKGTNNSIGGADGGQGQNYYLKNFIGGNTDGVLIDNGATGNVVQGNFIGLDISGTHGVGNVTGIQIVGSKNTIGGSAIGVGNTISGNSLNGIYLIASTATGNVVQGNAVGTDYTDSVAVANSGNGIEINSDGNTVGGTSAGASNLISGNVKDGVLIDSGASGNAVLGNSIGLDVTGTIPLANSVGIEVAGTQNTLGGSVASAGNVITGNSHDGVLLDSGATGNAVQGNTIGLEINGFAQGNGGNGVHVQSNTNTIGGTAAAARNVISGNGNDGVFIDGSSVSGNLILGNYIGLDSSGATAEANTVNGIEISGINNTIGSTASGAGNVISGNNNFVFGVGGGDGVLLDSTASGILVEGNYVGTNYTGTTAVANYVGIDVEGNNNTLGGTASADLNVISGNSSDGVFIGGNATGTVVQGNDIGINASSTSVANGGYGVDIVGNNNTVGGTASGAGNTIADNTAGGVQVSTGVGDTISRNSIFTNGFTPLGIYLNNGNNNLPAPTLGSANLSLANVLSVQGSYTAPTANVPYVLEIFGNPTNDPEGKVYLGSLTDTPTTTGAQSFTFTLSSPPAIGSYIAATVTDNTGDTSPFSGVVTVQEWIGVGPAPVSNGQTKGSLPISGRVTGIAADPTSADIVYVATAGGGIWKTNDATSGSPTWTPLTDNLTDTNGKPIPLFMGAVAETEDLSNNQIVYAGTGEANNSGDSYYGSGILVSRDGGSTWTLTGSAFAGNTISKIVIDPSDSSGLTAYAAVSDFGVNRVGFLNNAGIWKTTDGGASWTNTTLSLATPTLKADESPWSDVVIDPKTGYIYGAEGNFEGTFTDSINNGVYVSTDGGATWSPLSGLPSGTPVGRIALALYDDGTTDELVVSIANDYTDSSTAGELYEMLKVLNPDSLSQTVTNLNAPNFLGEVPYAQGWYDTTVAIDPNDANYIYAGGSDNGPSGPVNGNIESFDGGTTWQQITSDASGNGPHSDDHAVAFDANFNMLDGNDGGVFRLSNPDNSSTQAWTSLNTNLNTIQFYGISADPTVNNVIYGGTQDNGTEKYTGSTSWSLVLGGDGGVTRVDPTNHLRVYGENPDGGIAVSNDGGSTWSYIYSGLAGLNSVNFIAPYALDASGNIFFGTDYLNYSSNHGVTWTQIATPGSNSPGTGVNGFQDYTSPIDSIAVNPVANSNVVYVMISEEVFVTQNAQAGGNNVTWTQRDLPSGAPGSTTSAANRIVIDPSDTTGGTAYAVIPAFQNGTVGNVFKTTNFGVTWADITGNLPNFPVYSVAVSGDGKTVYVGTDVGVYDTTNGGLNWSQFDTGLPNAEVQDIDIVSSQNIMVIGTHGRGAWEVAISDPSSPGLRPPPTIPTGHPTNAGGSPTPTPSNNSVPWNGQPIASPEAPMRGNISGINLLGTSALSNGFNGNLAAPTLNSASLNGGTLTVQGSFNAPIASARYVLEFFSSISGDEQDKVAVGSLSLTPSVTGKQSFTFTTSSAAETGWVITATLSDAAKDKFEFSNGVIVS